MAEPWPLSEGLSEGLPEATPRSNELAGAASASRSVRRSWRIALVLLLLLLLATPFVVLWRWGGGYHVVPEPGERLAARATVAGDVGADEELAASQAAAERAQARYRERLARLGPKGAFVTVDTVDNKLRLYREGEPVLEALVSTGSGFRLVDQKRGREWVFETPFGEHKVERKTRNPIWVKPDWAFIENGEEPPENAWERVDKVSLGDYALYLGDGYLIHGTLFPSLLGKRVTHGCIRVGDEDLEKVYRSLPVGARVFLY